MKIAAASLIVVALLLAILERMQFVHDSILPFLQRAGDPDLYRLSFAIPRSVVPQASPVFDLLAMWRIDLATPWFTAPAYWLTTLVAGYLVWCILRDVAKLDNPVERLAVVFALGFADAKFVEFALVGWISQHNFTFTMVAGALRLWFLYAMLLGRFRLAVGILIVISLLTFKIGWPLLGFLGLILLWERNRDPMVWLGLLVSVIAPLAAALETQVSLSADEALSVFTDLRIQHGAEDNPFANRWPAFLLFAAAMAAGWSLAPRLLESTVAARVRIVILASIGVFVAGGAYIQANGFGHPIPAVILLSPARAVEAAIALVYMLLLLWVIRHPALAQLEKVALFAALIVLKVQPGGKLIAVTLAVTVAVALGWLVRQKVPLLKRLVQIGDRVPLGLLLSLPCLAISLVLLAGTQGARVRIDPALGFVPASDASSAMPMLRAIRAEQGDRLILFDRGPNDANLGNGWNYLTRKSALHYDLYYLRRAADIAEQKRRDAISRAVLSGLAAGSVSAQARQDLRDLGVTVVTERSKLSALAGWQVVAEHGTWVELQP